MPGESPAVFGDALRRLAAAATYLYQDGPRYWYATQPTVTKLAEDRAEQLRRDPDKVVQEVEKRLRADLRTTGDFTRVHPLPGTSADVPDDRDARLVVLGVDHTYSREPGNAAAAAARAILESRGSTPRLYRNALVFLAPDKTRMQDLDEAIRTYLAWTSILDEQEPLDLSPHQVRQAQTQQAAATSTVTARLPETYQWLLVPTQENPQAAVGWQAIRLAGQEALAVRASKKLRNDELLLTSLGATRLRLEMDRVPLWRGDHITITQLVDDFGRYGYLPRLKDAAVLLEAVRAGCALLTWEQDAFAYAESYDEAAVRYRGLRCGQHVPIRDGDTGVLVRPDVARQQLTAETQPGDGTTGIVTPPGAVPPPPPVPPPGPPAPPRPRRFHGTVTLDPARAGRDASKITDEVLTHLMGLLGSSVRVTLEIDAEIPDGVPDNVVWIVTENSRTLKFTSHGFESA
jgi:hypothetical protein